MIYDQLFCYICVYVSIECKESSELSTGQHFILWIGSQPLSLLLNNQLYPPASCPLDNELPSGHPHPVDNFIQYFEQPGPEDHFRAALRSFHTRIKRQDDKGSPFRNRYSKINLINEHYLLQHWKYLCKIIWSIYGTLNQSHKIQGLFFFNKRSFGNA
jgi:hypothetical protein